MKNVKVKFLWRDWPICEIMNAMREYKKNTNGEEEEKNCNLNLEKLEEIFCNAFNLSHVKSGELHFPQISFRISENFTSVQNIPVK